MLILLSKYRCGTVVCQGFIYTGLSPKIPDRKPAKGLTTREEGKEEVEKYFSKKSSLFLKGFGYSFEEALALGIALHVTLFILHVIISLVIVTTEIDRYYRAHKKYSPGDMGRQGTIEKSIYFCKKMY